MNQTTLPGLEKSFAYVRREAKSQNMMLGSGSTNVVVILPSVSMVSKALSSSLPHASLSPDIENKDGLQCTFCNGTHHTVDTCNAPNF